MSEPVTLVMADGREVEFNLLRVDDRVVLQANDWNLIRLHSSGIIARCHSATGMGRHSHGFAGDSNGRIIIDGPPVVFAKPVNPSLFDIIGAVGGGGVTLGMDPLTDAQRSAILAKLGVKP